MPGEPYIMESRPVQPDSSSYSKPLVIAVRPLDAGDAWELALDTGLWGELSASQETMALEFVVPFATYQDAIACIETVLAHLKEAAADG